MKLNLNRQEQCLLIGLLLVSFNVSAQDRNAAQTDSTVKSGQGKNAESAQSVGLDSLGKRTASKHVPIDIFKGKSWYVPPPPPPPAPPPPPPIPTAPPMPFSYMGSYRGDDGRLIIFLTKADHVYSVSIGDVIEGTYRVGEVVAGQLTLTYLPLNTPQTISIEAS